LRAAGIYIAPPKPHQDALVRIYLEHVQPILPILDQAEFERMYANGTSPLILAKAICIVASKHDKARPHLILGDSETVLAPRDFASKLYRGVVAAIAADVEKDRMMLIQVLALLSLYYEGYEGSVQASMHLTQATHHAHTFGLQLRENERDQKSYYRQQLF